MEQVRILLCEGEPVMRLGLRTLLGAQQTMAVVGECEVRGDFAEESAKLEPDVVLIDLDTARLSDEAAAETIRSLVMHARVIALSSIEDRCYVQSLLRAGASGYVVTRHAHDELERAIRTVAEGNSFVDPAIGEATPEQTRRGELSDRETEVLRLVAEGHVMKEIATMLGLSVRTLETYKARAMAKLNISSRVEIVRYALQRGWLRSN